ncbi:hypothetical protein ACULL3_19655 [Xanthomonas arboricola pv. corylina]|uniref:hypothetical protein n=1 Tax=Xanthomonas arboricola TaxID=56448 RepID=UPI00404089AE
MRPADLRATDRCRLSLAVEAFADVRRPCTRQRRARDIVERDATVAVSDFWREPVVRRWRAAGEKCLQRRLHPTSHTVRNACRWQRMRLHAWVENRAISLRIFACARPWASLVDKKFSAGGQAARTAASRRALLRRCSGQQRACLHRKKKNSTKEVLF